MTMLSNKSREDYTGTGATAVYAFNFRVLDAADLVVIQTDLNGLETNPACTVTGIGAPAGSITLTAGNLPTGYELVIKRVVDLTQPTSIRNQGAFFPEVHEKVFDRLTMIDQQQQEQLDRAMKLPEGSTADPTLPAASEGTILGWIGGKLANLSAATAQLSSDLLSSVVGKGAALITYLANITGAVSRTLLDRLLDRISVMDFMSPAQIANVRTGLGAGGDSALIAGITAAIQAAINAVSNSSRKKVYFPAGRYDYTRLYCYYDGSLNPGFAATRAAAVSFVGDGCPVDVKNRLGGSVLYCTSTTGDGVTVSPAALDDGATTQYFPSRSFYAEGISFTGANSGYLMVALGVPGFKTVNCQFVVTHANGSGLRLSSAWVGSLDKTAFTTYPYGFTTTGKAIAFSSTLAGGLFTIRDCTADGFAYGFHFLSGSALWQNFNFVDSEIIGSTYALYFQSAVQLVSVRGCYFEGPCTSFIADAGANQILQLSVRDTWFLSNFVTGATINLNAPNAVNIEACFVQDQEVSGKAFLNIVTVADSAMQSPYKVSNVNFVVYGTPIATTLFTGQIPALYGIDWYQDRVPTTLLFPAGKCPIVTTRKTDSTATLSAGHLTESKILAYGALPGGYVGVLTTDVSGDYPSFVSYYCAGASVILRLPSVAWMTARKLQPGVGIGITNHMSSANPGTITDGEASPTTKCNLAPGAYRKFVWDGTQWT